MLLYRTKYADVYALVPSIPTLVPLVQSFIGAINMQLSNPAMASSVADFAGTYASQMKAEISQMVALNT